MNTTKERSWTPVKGEQFEAVSVGNVTVKLYRRNRPTANRKKKRTPESLARNWARFMNWVLAVDGSGFIFWKHCVGLVVERRECLGWKETSAMVFLS